MKDHKGEHGYYNEQVNEDGWVVGMNQMLFGIRVVVYHKDDKVSCPGNLCAGADPTNLMLLYAHIGTWLSTNPKEVVKTLHYLHSLEKVRPYGKSPELVEAVEKLTEEK